MNLRDLIPHEYKVQFNILKMNLRGNPIYKLSDYPNGKKIYMFLAADYGNLGDVALTYAQLKFLNKHFPEYTVVEIIIRNSVEGLQFAKAHVQNGDIISIIGGGNMGTIYPGLENFRQYIIKAFPNHKIISFPQTIHFSNDEVGRKALAQSQKVYSSHPGFVLVAREPKSFELMRQSFPKNKVLLTPDIVFSQNQSKPEFERKGVTVSLRRDIEKNLTPAQDEILNRCIGHNFSDVRQYDTNINRPYLTTEQKYQELHKIWDAYKRSELVITDRLHGMIFCYITNTPGIIFLNNNHKIEASYEWIKFSTCITLVREFTEDSLNDLFMRYKNTRFENSYQSLDHLYQPLIEAIGS